MNSIMKSAVETFETEAAAVKNLSNLLTEDFEGAVKAILACRGKVIVTGMGKSGLVGRKIAATLASTGTPSFFLHPGEAYHGDLGMIGPEDVVIAIANSGQTDEILKLIPFLQLQGNTVIAMTGNPASLLAQHARYHLNIGVEKEACPLNLTPTSSTATTSAMGDALAVALIRERGFKAEDYAVFHPGGSLGRRLLTRVRDVMRSDSLPLVSRDTTLGDVIIAISNARLGVAMIVDEGRLAGLISDGDVRRAMLRFKESFLGVRAEEIMTPDPKVISPDELIIAAEEMMSRYKIHSVVVTDDERHVLGLVEFFNVSVAGR